MPVEGGQQQAQPGAGRDDRDDRAARPTAERDHRAQAVPGEPHPRLPADHGVGDLHDDVRRPRRPTAG